MPVTHTENVRDIIRAALAHKRLKQWELAVELGWSQVRLSRRMSGKVAWSAEDLVLVGIVLELAPSELIGALTSP